MQTTPVILKIGGSLLSKSDADLFDFAYFEEFKQLLTKLTAQGHKFIISIGGGYVTRKYQQMLAANGEHDTNDLHRVGVATTNLNAEIFHGLLNDLAMPQVLRYADFDAFLEKHHDGLDFGTAGALIISGSRPGQSNDWNALQFALNLGIKRVIDVKNVDAVYTADPVSDPRAQRVPKLNWKQYLDIIGNPQEHVPGANYPVDPIAARESEQNGIEFVIVSGTDIPNLEKAILSVDRQVAGEDFSGSVISG